MRRKKKKPTDELDKKPGMLVEYQNNTAVGRMA